MGLPGGNLFYIGLFRENITEIFSENIRPRALIYKAKNVLSHGITCCIQFYIEKYKIIFLSRTTRPRALLFCM